MPRNGQPRLLSCERPTVFNPETGLCDQQENVPGCEDTYREEEELLGEGERDRIAQAIRKQLEKEFGLNRN